MFRFLDSIGDYKQFFDELQEMFSKGINKLRSGIKSQYGFG